MKKMYKKIVTLLILSLGLIFLSSCVLEEDYDGEYKVTFVFNDQTKITKNTIDRKITPEEMPNQFRYNFKGWYLGNEEFNFNSKVTKNITLEAKYNDKLEHLVREVHIDLDDPSQMYLWNNNKKTDLKATIKYFSDNNFQIEEHNIKIRGRGNSTWSMPKKPYRIKFDDATSMFGMRKAKLYVLLADYADPSGLRNFLGHEFSKMLNIDYAIETRHIELYFNGEYQGMYLLTEQVQVYKNRLNLTMDEKPDSGFLIELEADERMEGEGDEDFNWVRVNDRNYLIKYPKDDDYSVEDYTLKAAYIKSYLQDMENSFLDGTYANYLDVDQFIDYFVLQELFKNVDINFSSVFAYKDEGGLLKMGPLWDFDISLGNGNYFDYSPYHFHAVNHPWLGKLLKDEDFKEKYVNRFLEVLEEYTATLLNILDAKQLALEKYFNEDNDKWQTFNKHYWPVTNEMASKTKYSEYVELIKEFISLRSWWLLNNLDKL